MKRNDDIFLVAQMAANEIREAVLGQPKRELRYLIVLAALERLSKRYPIEYTVSKAKGRVSGQLGSVIEFTTEFRVQYVSGRTAPYVSIKKK